MTAAVAAVVLAHNDAPKVRRLIGSLAGADVFLHSDRSTPRSVANEMVNRDSPATLIPRRRTRLASWSLVAAELAGLQLALERSRAHHIAVMSGSCYPLLSMAELEAELQPWRGYSRLELNELPWRGWNTPRHPDGGQWRFHRRFWTIRGQVVSVRGAPVPLLRRAIPPGLDLRASSQWKIYSRQHAQVVLSILNDNPSLLRFWRSTYVPDESCVASILQSPLLVGAVTEMVCDDLPWFLRWPKDGSAHPAWLGIRDIETVREAATAPTRTLDTLGLASRARPFRKFFARKIGSHDGPLMDFIDEDLRR